MTGLKNIVRPLFIAGFISLILFIILEFLRPGLVISHLSLNWWGTAVLVLGIIDILLEVERSKK